MTDIPLHLIVHLASKSEQVRYVTGGTKAEYLAPEDLLNDAFHFCERMRGSATWPSLSDPVRAAVGQFEQDLKRRGDCTDRYEHSTVGELIERDGDWAILRDEARDLFKLFGETPPT